MQISSQSKFLNRLFSQNVDSLPCEVVATDDIKHLKL